MEGEHRKADRESAAWRDEGEHRTKSFPNGDPVVTPLDEVNRTISGPEQLLDGGPPAPAFLITKNHSLYHNISTISLPERSVTHLLSTEIPMIMSKHLHIIIHGVGQDLDVL